MNINAIEMSAAARASNTSLCLACSARNHCPAGLADSDAGPPVLRRIKLVRGETLFQQGDTIGGHFFIVYSGALKVYACSLGGKSMIVRFPIHGDMVGVESAGTGAQPHGAMALEDSYLCEVPFHDELTGSAPFQQALSHEIAREQKLCSRLRQSGASRRLAMFLLATGARLSRRGYSSTRYRLAMARSDIANHLGLTPESISRNLLQFSQAGLLELQGREVRLLDAEALLALAEHTDGDAGDEARQGSRRAGAARRPVAKTGPCRG